MKTGYLLLLLIVVLCAAAIAQQQGDRRSRDYATANGITWHETITRNTDADQDGVFHPDSATVRGLRSRDTILYRSRIDTLSKMPLSPLPYIIDKRIATMTQETQLNEGASEIQTFVPEKQWTRTAVYDDYEYVTHLQISHNFRSFIFAKRLMSFDFHKVPMVYYLTNVDTNGYFISSLSIASFVTEQEIETAEVTADGVIRCHKYKQVWDKDPLQQGYKDNTVKERIPAGEKTYQITPTGDIILKK